MSKNSNSNSVQQPKPGLLSKIGGFIKRHAKKLFIAAAVITTVAATIVAGPVGALLVGGALYGTYRGAKAMNNRINKTSSASQYPSKPAQNLQQPAMQQQPSISQSQQQSQTLPGKSNNPPIQTIDGNPAQQAGAATPQRSGLLNRAANFLKENKAIIATAAVIAVGVAAALTVGVFAGPLAIPVAIGVGVAAGAVYKKLGGPPIMGNITLKSGPSASPNAKQPATQQEQGLGRAKEQSHGPREATASKTSSLSPHTEAAVNKMQHQWVKGIVQADIKSHQSTPAHAKLPQLRNTSISK